MQDIELEQHAAVNQGSVLVEAQGLLCKGESAAAAVAAGLEQSRMFVGKISNALGGDRKLDLDEVWLAINAINPVVSGQANGP